MYEWPKNYANNPLILLRGNLKLTEIKVIAQGDTTVELWSWG